MDLFANRWNRKYSLQGLDNGSQTDAFMLAWLDSLMYIFPPIPLIHKVLIKLKRDKARIIPVTPAWPPQTLFGMLLSLSVVYLWALQS